MSKEWFASWFDSPYYHLLYNKRDFHEAEIFITNLIKHLQPVGDASFLDLACGKGRHSKFINSFGYDTIGVDLSPQSIASSKEMEKEGLSFFVHDMRNAIVDKQFDFVLNLFTSFGYFDSYKENLKVLNSISSYLKPNGVLVIDFLNAIKVEKNLVQEEEVRREDVVFKLKRKVDSGLIKKQINFQVEDENFQHTEQVQALKLNDFKQLFEKSGFELVESFGNYNLESFQEDSDRLIMLVKKK